MKKILTLAFGLLTIFLAKAQPGITIKGTVTDNNGNGLAQVLVRGLPGNVSVITDAAGHYQIKMTGKENYLVFAKAGYTAQKIKINGRREINITLMQDAGNRLPEVAVVEQHYSKSKILPGRALKDVPAANVMSLLQGRVSGINRYPNTYANSESYAHIAENGFKSPASSPLSTFSIDVDAAGYSNVRRFINNGQLPPTDAVRVEEMINYFNYRYPQPAGNVPVNIITEVSAAPWNTQHQLVQVALQGKHVNTEGLPAGNFVFLIDVSGSMAAANKLPLLVASFKMLVDKLRPQDKVAIVTYAGNAGVAMPSTSGKNKTKIKDVLNSLTASGSTNGAGGLEKAYMIATGNFIKKGNNRIILATDGDFNVGLSGDNDMEKLIEAKRASGIFLTVLGFGMGNYKDSKMEILADKGNGNYAYIDNSSEARKVLLKEFGSTMFTIAKDVKLQVEFNPAKVQAYRLVGYENRALNDEDFNDDQKDAGEMGAGQTVTAFYEIIPAGVKDQWVKSIDELKYRDTKPADRSGNELLTVKLRYKDPEGNKSRLLTKVVKDRTIPFAATSDNFRFASAVAGLGMLLHQSEYVQKMDYATVINIAANAKGQDEEGYRAGFVEMAETAAALQGNEAVSHQPPVYRYPGTSFRRNMQVHIIPLNAEK